jgi:hypothetical protein
MDVSWNYYVQHLDMAFVPAFKPGVSSAGKCVDAHSQAIYLRLVANLPLTSQFTHALQHMSIEITLYRHYYYDMRLAC